MARRRLFGNFIRFKVGSRPDDRSELPIVKPQDEIVNQVDSADTNLMGSLNQFRMVSDDRETLYGSYDEMKTDSVISAALELYADDATQYDEQGRIIWVESDSDEITKAGNRLLDILEIPERAWKHIYQSCLYGDHYLKLYRMGELDDEDEEEKNKYKSSTVKVVNDREVYKGHTEIPNFEEYVEDVPDPALVFDLRKRGKTAGFIEIDKDIYASTPSTLSTMLNTLSFTLKDINIYRPDRFIHIMLGESMSRTPETVTIDYGDGKSASYETARGKSILQDVYPIQKELQLLEDSLLLNRLTRSSLIRLLEIEVGDMPKKEVNDYLRRIKNLIEQHIALDKNTGTYKSFNAPGPIDNVIYIPVRNQKGHIDINNLGGDVNIRDIADVEYFNNKRAGALKIPRAYLGDSMDGSGLSNGGSLTRLDIRYARTIKRIQTAYIRAITTLLNLFFDDKKLDYINKFKVKMTSPSTQEDLERNELINGNIELVGNIMDLTDSLEGGTQKKILTHLISNIMHMPEISEIIEEDQTPEEEIDIEGGRGFDGPDLDMNIDMSTNKDGTLDASNAFEGGESEESSDGEVEGGFTEADFSEFEDEI